MHLGNTGLKQSKWLLFCGILRAFHVLVCATQMDPQGGRLGRSSRSVCQVNLTTQCFVTIM